MQKIPQKFAHTKKSPYICTAIEGTWQRRGATSERRWQGTADL